MSFQFSSIEDARSFAFNFPIYKIIRIQGGFVVLIPA